MTVLNRSGTSNDESAVSVTDSQVVVIGWTPVYACKSVTINLDETVGQPVIVRAYAGTPSHANRNKDFTDPDVQTDLTNSKRQIGVDEVWAASEKDFLELAVNGKFEAIRIEAIRQGGTSGGLKGNIVGRPMNR